MRRPRSPRHFASTLPAGELALEPVDPAPLAGQRPAPGIPVYRPLPERAVEEYVGRYRISSGAEIRVFRFEGKPYVHVPGEGDALLFATGEDRFTVRVVSGVSIAFQRDAAGKVAEVELTLGGDTIRAERVGDEPPNPGRGTKRPRP